MVSEGNRDFNDLQIYTDFYKSNVEHHPYQILIDPMVHMPKFSWEYVFIPPCKHCPKIVYMFKSVDDMNASIKSLINDHGVGNILVVNGYPQAGAQVDGMIKSHLKG